jgi:hypothetical protein
MTQISLPIGPITVSFWLEPIVMVRQPLSLPVRKKPAIDGEGLAVKLSSVAVSELKTKEINLSLWSRPSPLEEKLCQPY